MTTAATAQASNDPKDGYIYITADQAFSEVLMSLCRRYKGINPVIDAKIDAVAPVIALNNNVKAIPGERPGAPRVPLYFEGEPGVGKTVVPRAAAQQFCAITGLNFVEEPADDYVIKPEDFFFMTVNLSGKNNVSDFGGLPMRSEAQARSHQKARRKAAEMGSIVMAEIESRARGATGALGLTMADVKNYEEGDLAVLELAIKGDANLAARAAECVLKQVADEAKRQGLGLSMLKGDAAPEENRVSYTVQHFTGGAKLAVYSPRPMEDEIEYVASVLPNRRFAQAKKARFSLINFDDVANANEQVRNVLLEVAQSNRYSGVMDIGSAVVTFSGNMGAEDNTNVMSRQSDAEVTRIRKYRVMDTPEDWARRITAKYGQSVVGDCHFASFIKRQGSTPGVFREASGTARGKRGVPKTNSRALENALAAVDGYFLMAHESGMTPGIFLERIRRDVAATAGKTVADSYHAHVQSMITEAIPLAEEVLNTGKLNQEKFDRYAGGFRATSGQDFGYRFASALADGATQMIAFQKQSDPAAQQTHIAKVIENMCNGLCHIQPGMSNFALSTLAVRLSHLKAFGVDSNTGFVLNQDVYEALTDGFARSVAKGVWGNANETEKAKEDFISCISGARNISATGKMKTAKP